jgi:hypothetical protein
MYSFVQVSANSGKPISNGLPQEVPQSFGFGNNSTPMSVTPMNNMTPLGNMAQMGESLFDSSPQIPPQDNQWAAWGSPVAAQPTELISEDLFASSGFNSGPVDPSFGAWNSTPAGSNIKKFIASFNFEVLYFIGKKSI